MVREKEWHRQQGNREGQVIACAGNSANVVMKFTFGSRLPFLLRMMQGDKGGRVMHDVSWGSPRVASKPSPSGWGRIRTETVGQNPPIAITRRPLLGGCLQLGTVAEAKSTPNVI